MTESFYNSYSEIPEHLRIDLLDLREISKQCTTDTLDLADPKYNLSGKYVLESNRVIVFHKRLNSIKHIKNIDTLNFQFCTMLDSLFANFTELESIEGLENIDTSNVLSMNWTFSHCHSLEYLNLTNWNTSNVKHMCCTFNCCKSLEHIEGIENIDTSNVRWMTGLFFDCQSLRVLNLSNWNTSNVEIMKNMFRDCEKLSLLMIDNWIINQKVNMINMFLNCKSLQNIDLTNCNDYDKISGLIKNIITYGYDIKLIVSQNYTNCSEFIEHSYNIIISDL